MGGFNTLPNNGIASDTCGNFSATTVMKTVRDSRIVISERKGKKDTPYISFGNCSESFFVGGGRGLSERKS